MEIKTILLDFIEGKIVPAEFENYIYFNERLEAELGDEIYTDLISIDYRDGHCREEVTKLLEPLLDYGELHKNRIIDTIDAILGKKIRLLDGINELYDWMWKGYHFLAEIPLISNFGEQGKSVVQIIENEDKDQEIWKKVLSYEPDLLSGLTNIKHQLLNDEIILTGEKQLVKHYGVRFQFRRATGN